MSLKEEANHYPNPTPKYLKNGDTGYVYVYSEKLFDEGNWKPCNTIPDAQLPPEKRAKKTTEPEKPQEVVDTADQNLNEDGSKKKSLLQQGIDAAKNIVNGGQDGEKQIKHMNMEELLTFAKVNFDKDLEPQLGLKEVRDQIYVLQQDAAEIHSGGQAESTDETGTDSPSTPAK